MDRSKTDCTTVLIIFTYPNCLKVGLTIRTQMSILTIIMCLDKEGEKNIYFSTSLCAIWVSIDVLLMRKSEQNI